MSVKAISIENEKMNQAAFEIGQLTERMASAYYAHQSALDIASHPSAKILAPSVLPGHLVPIGFVSRNDGTQHAFHFNHSLDQVSRNVEFQKVWLIGSLLSIGDALSQYDYFDHAPELELLYHLRNGVAHGNKFHFNANGRKRLRMYPADNKLAWCRSHAKTDFQISENMNGQKVLFDFMGAGDILDLFMSVGLYLIRMGNGDSLRPLPT